MHSISKASGHEYRDKRLESFHHKSDCTYKRENAFQLLSAGKKHQQHTLVRKRGRQALTLDEAPSLPLVLPYAARLTCIFVFLLQFAESQDTLNILCRKNKIFYIFITLNNTSFLFNNIKTSILSITYPQSQKISYRIFQLITKIIHRDRAFIQQ